MVSASQVAPPSKEVFGPADVQSFPLKGVPPGLGARDGARAQQISGGLGERVGCDG